MQIINKILNLSIAWSIIYFGTGFLIEKTKKNLCFPGISFSSSPEKISVTPQFIKIYFQNTKFDLNGFSIIPETFILEINPVSLVSNKPFISFELTNAHCNSSLGPQALTNVAKKLKQAFFENPTKAIKKISIEGIYFNSDQVKYDFCYNTLKKADWKVSLAKKTSFENINHGTSFKLEKTKNLFRLEIEKNGKIIAQVNLAKSKKDNWLLFPESKTQHSKGIIIKRSVDRLLVYNRPSREFLGTISHNFRKCDLNFNLNSILSFLPSENGLEKKLNFKYILTENQFLGILTEATNKTYPIASLILTNNFSQAKFLACNKLLNYGINLFWPKNIRLDGDGAIECTLENNIDKLKLSGWGKNLNLENNFITNPIDSFKIATQISKKTGLASLEFGSINFKQGNLTLKNGFFKLSNSSNPIPETIFVKGIFTNFGLEIPKTCSIVLDCDFGIFKNDDRMLVLSDINLCKGLINNNKLWTSEAKTEFQSNLQLPETKLIINLKNKHPISVINKDSCFKLNFDLNLPIVMKKRLPEYHFCTYPSGKITISSGNFSIVDNIFKITSGSILLNKKFDYKPIIDLHANTKIKKHLVDLNLFGPLNQPFANFRSNTNLAHDKIAAMIFSGHGEELVENQMMKIFPAFLVDVLNKQMTVEKSSNKLIQKLGDALYIARNPTTNMKITPYLIESKLGKLGAALSFNPSPRFYTYLKKDVLNKDCLIVDAEYLLGDSSSLNFSRDKNKAIKGELEFKFKF